jgi:hypothetical protein
MADVVHGPRLREEARDHLGIGRDVGVQDLDGSLAADERVLGQIDAAHAPLTQLAQHGVGADPSTEQVGASDREGVARALARGRAGPSHLEDGRHRFDRYSVFRRAS